MANRINTSGQTRTGGVPAARSRPSFVYGSWPQTYTGQRVKPAAASTTQYGKTPSDPNIDLIAAQYPGFGRTLKGMP